MSSNKLFNKNFNLLLISQLVNQTGCAIFRIGIVTWLVQETNSPDAVSWFFTAMSLPLVIFGPFGGAIADRLSRKHVIVFSDLMLAALLLLMFVANSFLTDFNTILPLLLVTGAMSSVAGSMRGPAVGASVLNIVPLGKIMPATSLLQNAFNVSIMIGRACAGVLMMYLSAPLIILLNSMTYFISAGGVGLLTLPAVEKKQKNNFQETMSAFKDEMIEGVYYVIKRPGLRVVFATFPLNSFFNAPIIVIMPFLVENTLQAPAYWYGPLLAGSSLGAVIGNSVAGILRISSSNRGKFVVFSIAFTFLSYIAISYSTSVIHVLILLVLSGGCMGLNGVMVISTLQRTTPNRVRGRVLSLFGTAMSLFLAISLASSGMVAKWLDNDMALFFFIYGLLGLFICPPLMFSKAFHRWMGYDAEVTAPVKSPSP